MLDIYSSENFWTDAFVLGKLYFEKYLILDFKTTLRLQKPQSKNFWSLKV